MKLTTKKEFLEMINELYKDLDDDDVIEYEVTIRKNRFSSGENTTILSRKADR